MSNAYLYRCPAGIPGDVTRREAAIISAEIIDADVPVTVFGSPVTMVEGKIQPINAGSEVVYGFLVRPYPAQGTSNEALATATPNTEQTSDVLRRGYMTVLCTTGTPEKDGKVYVNTTDGTIQTTAGQLIPDCFFTGAGDANGNVEISFGIAVS